MSDSTLDLDKILIACPSIRHRNEMTINGFNRFPNKVIFGEAQEQSLYSDYIDAGWKWVEQESPRYIGKIRNQILQYFKDSDFDYLLIIDDEVIYRQVMIDANGNFCTKATDDIFKEWCAEFARMKKEELDILTVPNSQFLSGTMEKALHNKQGIDYCAIALSRKIFKFNYWYIDHTGIATDLKICEDKVFARMLLSNPDLHCSYSIFLRREVQAENKGNSTFGDTDNHRVAMDGANEVLSKIKNNGYTKELMESLWKKEHFPNVFYPITFNSTKKYISEKQEITKWKQFINVK